MHNVTPMPRDENTGPADVLGIHRTLRPDTRRGNVARQLYIDTWTLTLVDRLHVPRTILRDCTLWLGAHQYLNWLTFGMVTKVIIRLQTLPSNGGSEADFCAGTQEALSYRIPLEFWGIFAQKLSRIFLLTTEVNSPTMRNVCGDTLQIFHYLNGFTPHFGEMSDDANPSVQ